MKLLLIVITATFLTLFVGKESRQVSENTEICNEVVVHPTQIASGSRDCLLPPRWLKSYFFILNILNPTRQFDLPGDHDKSWYSLHARILRSAQDIIFSVRQQPVGTGQFLRLLSARHLSGFYVYSLEKLLI